MAGWRFCRIPYASSSRQGGMYKTSFVVRILLTGIVLITAVTGFVDAEDKAQPSEPDVSTLSNSLDSNTSSLQRPVNSHLPRRFRQLTTSTQKYVPQPPNLTPELLSRFPGQNLPTDQIIVTSGLRRLDSLMQGTLLESQADLKEPPLPDEALEPYQAGWTARPITNGNDQAVLSGKLSGVIIVEQQTVDSDSETVRKTTHNTAKRIQELNRSARVVNFQIPEDKPNLFEKETVDNLGHVAEKPVLVKLNKQEIPREADEAISDVTVSDKLPFEVITPDSEPIVVTVRRNVLMRSDFDIYRTAVVDPEICNLVQFTPREVSIIGNSVGSTTVTVWFTGQKRPLPYVVHVEPDLQARRQLEDEYEVLARILTELFPDSKVELLPVADKLIVRGQAKDAQEAAQVLQIIRTQTGLNRNVNAVPPGVQSAGSDPTVSGQAAAVMSANETGNRTRSGLTLVNLLRVPGPQQIALKVKIAELNRTAARGFGVDVETNINVSDSAGLFVQSMLNATTALGSVGSGPSVISQFSGDDIQIGVRWLEQEGVIRMLSEPTLVTLSGRPATFVAGGEFAVPTAVGVGGIGAVTTDFRTFGAIISFLPTVIDKDYIRLEVSPEFSQINSNLSNNNSFGLDVRSVTTTVEMREGQTLAIAGLIDDSMTGMKRGDIPFLSQLFGRRDISRNETELIILVTPELIHPMDPEEVPPLPGFDISEPTNKEFFMKGHLEGNSNQNFRSTIWPRLRRRYQGQGTTMISGPYGHGQ